MSSKATITGFDDMTAMFRRAAELLDNEAAIRDVMHDVLRPVADEMYSRVQKRSGRTADDIRIDDESSDGDTLRVAVGFGQWGFIANLLEYGTAKRRAFPFMRPAYDGQGGDDGVTERVTAGLLALIEPALR